MYYLYHIKGVKWGCSKNLHKRLKSQGYTINDVYEIIEVVDINEAANMERDFNIRDGYDWNDSQDYRIIIKAAKAALLVDYNFYFWDHHTSPCLF